MRTFSVELPKCEALDAILAVMAANECSASEATQLLILVAIERVGLDPVTGLIRVKPLPEGHS